MLMLMLIILFIAAEPPTEGQAFRGSKFSRLPGKKYTHAKKRKKFSDGQYHYFD